jgi:VanZ family protein
MVAIFHFSSEPDPLPQLTQTVWDKLLHVVEFAGLAWLLCRALRGEGVAWTAATLLALGATSIYAASDEWHQAFVPLRNSDVLDWVADTIGAAVGAAIYALVAISMVSRPRHRPRR